MFNNERIMKLEEEVFRRHTFPGTSLNQKIDGLRENCSEARARVNSVEYNMEILERVVKSQQAEIAKLKDIVREVTDYVYKDAPQVVVSEEVGNE